MKPIYFRLNILNQIVILGQRHNKPTADDTGLDRKPWQQVKKLMPGHVKSKLDELYVNTCYFVKSHLKTNDNRICSSY